MEQDHIGALQEHREIWLKRAPFSEYHHNGFYDGHACPARASLDRRRACKGHRRPGRFWGRGFADNVSSSFLVWKMWHSH